MQKIEALVRSDSVTLAQQSYRRTLFTLLQSLKFGGLTINEHFVGGEQHHWGSDPAGNLHATIDVYQPDFYARAIKGGSIGAAESYIDGEWDSPDLTQALQLIALNMATLDQIEKKASLLVRLGFKLSHWFNRNSVARSKHNIHAHYDLGNDLYCAFLDANMLYSSALYLGTNETLEQAQINKMDRLCQQLKLTATDHVLEIGTGWGAMAIYMAQRYGCHVTTTTISVEQYRYVQEKVESLGLTDKITLLTKDYRHLTGSYDKIVSIEMIEAVGQEYLKSYIEQCHTLLKPGGLVAIQAITIADQRYDYYRTHVDFIQKYIFPGGFLPSVTCLLNAMTAHSAFVMRDLSDMGLDYARTLQEWRERFIAKAEQLDSDKYDDRFSRLWLFYLCYCEAGFRAKTTSAIQITFEKVAHE